MLQNLSESVHVLPRVCQGLVGSIGNTPLIRLNSLSNRLGCNILGKAEYTNLGGSVKDRTAWFLIKDAEENGLIHPNEGYQIVEGTAGNTGIGLAHICRARGYECVIYIPDTQSIEKIQLLQSLGADVRAVPAVPYSDPNHFSRLPLKHAALASKAVALQQFENVANSWGHFRTTGPEIWQQTSGKIDGFVCATGTGGTLSGVGKYLKETSGGSTAIWCADPPGAVLYDYVKHGAVPLDRSGSSITEGIGQGRVTDNFIFGEKFIDDAVRIEDGQTIAMVFHLLHEEGIYVGASSALNVVAACKLAQKLGPNSTVVTILCDSAQRYSSRLFSSSWLDSKGLLKDVPLDCRKYLKD